jgi:hypothetical protein
MRLTFWLQKRRDAAVDALIARSGPAAVLGWAGTTFLAPLWGLSMIVLPAALGLHLALRPPGSRLQAHKSTGASKPLP